MANLSFQNSLQLYLWTLMYKLPALLQRSSLACVGRQEQGTLQMKAAAFAIFSGTTLRNDPQIYTCKQDDPRFMLGG